MWDGIILCILAFAVIAASTTACEEDEHEHLAREWIMDNRMHECRACKMIPLIADGNCPTMNYDCEEDLVVTTNVLHVDECACSQLQCRDANATLAVDGSIVGKVRCEHLTWTTAPNSTAESAVCARKCDLGVCPVFAAEGPIFGPLIVSAPDEDHPCAWADCQIGAVAKKDSADLVYRGPSSFACTGDRTWKYTGPKSEKRHLQDVACIIKDCESLPFGSASAMCDGAKYTCYRPDFVEGDGDDWKKMTCPVPRALRLSEQNKEAAPTCKIGQWSVDATNIEDTTKVVCVTCPNVKKELSDVEQPIESDRNREVTCAIGQLTVEYESNGPQQTPVTTLMCSNDFVWAATGGDFTPFDSLEDIARQAVAWKVRCKGCQSLPSGSASAMCDAKKYKCYEPDFVDGDGEGSKKMTCPFPHALRLSEENKEAAPTCKKGQWSVDAINIEESTKVVCVDCATVVTVPNDPIPATVSGDNKFVTCSAGKLTVEYESGAGLRQTEVTSVSCSDKFAWTTLGGEFAPFDSLEDAVSQGAAWTVRCIETIVKECQSLPIVEDESYCYDENTKPNAKYECSLPTYWPEPGAIRMRCPGELPPRLRYADNVEEVILPTCINGLWKDAGNPISETTKVTCIRCRILTLMETDAEVIYYEDPVLGKAALCPTLPLVIDILNNGVLVRRIPVNTIKCNYNTYIWETEGADFTGSGYSSFMELMETGVEHAVRCRNQGDP